MDLSGREDYTATGEKSMGNSRLLDRILPERLCSSYPHGSVKLMLQV